MTGILFLFLLPQAAGARDSENFYNPGISSVEIDVMVCQIEYTLEE